MGRVYLARARGPAGFEKLVALKSIHGELASEPAFVEMFLDEARIAARIVHPNVCGVFDFGKADGQYYLAMEYLLGETVGKLRKRLSAGSREEGYDYLVARIIAEAAEGLHAAHELTDEHGRPLEIVHRDVSPQNLFVTYDGNVKVVDFGIASAQGRLHRTATGSVKGKFAYMAPEQMRRESADRRVDVWALGVVLWELLTWDRMYKGGNEVETILAVLNDPIRPPGEVRPGLDPELDAIVMRALRKDRDQRYATARELSRALNRWIVARGQVIGAEQLGDLMRRVFANEYREAQELLDHARRTQPTSEIPFSIAPPSGGRVSPEPPPDERSTTRSVSRAEGESPEGAPATIPAPPPVALASSVDAPTKKMRPAIPILGAIAALAAMAGVGWLVGRSSSPDAEHVVVSSSSETQLATLLPAASPTTPQTAPPLPAASATPEDAPTVAEAPEPPEPDERPVEAAPSDPTPMMAVDSPPRASRTKAASPSSMGRARSQEAATGTLHVTTPGGWADVYLNGRRAGRSPLELTLPHGRASIELRPFGLAPLGRDASLRRTVTIGARPTRVSVPLAP